MTPAERAFFDKLDEVRQEITSKHGEVLRVVREESEKLARKLDEHAEDDREMFGDHGDRLKVIETERRLEGIAAKKVEDRAVNRSTWVTIFATGGLGLLELWAHMSGHWK